MSGEVKDQSKKFAPSGVEFVEEARRRQEFLELMSRPRQEYISYSPGPLAPCEVARKKALQKLAGLTMLAENITYEAWQRMSALRQVPVGARWSAATCNVYSGFEENFVERRKASPRIAKALEMLNTKNGAKKATDAIRHDFLAKYGEEALNALPNAPAGKAGTFNQVRNTKG